MSVMLGNCLQQMTFKDAFFLGPLRAIPEKKTLDGEDGRQYIFLWVLVRKVFKLYGSLVSDQI